MTNIKNSTDIKYSDSVDSSRSVYSSYNVYSSCYVYSSRNVYSSYNVDSSRSVYSSYNVDSSCRVYSSYNVDSSRSVIFCYDIRGKELYAFNKQVTVSRYYEIRDAWYVIQGNFKLDQVNNSWEDAWKELPQQAWIELSKLPEFDQEVVEDIIGFKLDLSQPKEMTVAQISEKLGYDVKIVK